MAAYTYVRSEFSDYKDELIPSSWDSRHLFTLTLNQSFKRNWDLGLKWRYVGGLPYTPYDYNKSTLIEAWDVNNQQYLNYALFNTERLEPFHQLDIRIDKTYNFDKWTLGFYLDIQNVYNKQADQPATLIQGRDENGKALIDRITSYNVCYTKLLRNNLLPFKSKKDLISC